MVGGGQRPFKKGPIIDISTSEEEEEKEEVIINISSEMEEEEKEEEEDIEEEEEEEEEEEDLLREGEGEEYWAGFVMPPNVKWTIDLYQPCTIIDARTGEVWKERMHDTFFFYK